MARYRVKPGFTFGPAGLHKAGAVVELDPADAAGFLDKLIPLDEEQATPALANTAQVVIPEEMKFIPGEAGDDEEAGIILTEDPKPASKPARKTAPKKKSV